MNWLADLLKGILIVGGMFVAGTLAMLLFLFMWLAGVV